MPTSDRTTIKAAIDEFINKLTTNLVAEPPTATRPFRRVSIGEAGTDEYPRPFLTVRLSKTTLLGSANEEKIFHVAMKLRFVADVTVTDPHSDILNKIGAIEDYLDSIRNTGVLDGSEGYDDREWTITYPSTTAGARVAIAEATQTCVVKVQRQQNRVPA